MRDQPEDIARFLDELEKQGTKLGACQTTGISKTTIYRWLQEDKQFRKDVDKMIRRTHDRVSDVAKNNLIAKIYQGDIGVSKFWVKTFDPYFKSPKERREIEDELLQKYSRLSIPRLGQDDIEY